MALDPSDLIGTPFNIGKCSERNVIAPVHCDAWATTNQYMRVVIQKEGNRHNIFFPEYVAYAKLGVLTKDCDIVVDLSEWLANEESDFDITSCRSRHFQGNMQYYNEKEHDDKLGVATVDYDREKGTFTFEPVTNYSLNTDSVAASEVFGVGILPTMITIDEEFDGWKKEEIEDDFVIPDIDMDYEEKREEAYEEEKKEEGPIGGDITIDENEQQTEETKGRTAKCGAWVNGGTGFNTYVTFWKNTQGYGKISFQSIMHQVAKLSTLTTNEVIIGVKETEIKEFFGGYIPSGSLGTCKVYNYCVTNGASDANYKEVDGIIYYYNGNFRITPNYSDWKYFYPVTSDDVTQKEIGLIQSDWTCTFKILSEKPTYTNLRENVPIIDLSEDESPTTKDYLVTVANGAWSPTNIDDVTISFTKNGNLGTIKIPALMSTISETRSQTNGAELLIYCTAEINEFFEGKIPSGMLATCKVYGYWPQSYATEDNYKTVDGCIFYYNNGLHIVPNTEYYHYFYGIKEVGAGRINPKEIGLPNELSFTFTIPDTKPETYTNINTSYSQTLDLSSVPSTYVKTVEVTFICQNWDIAKTTTGYVTEYSKKVSVKFTKEGDVGKIIFPQIYDSSQYMMGVGYGMYSLDFKTAAEEFFGNVPNKELGEFKAVSYLPENKGTTYYSDVNTKIYYSKDYGLVFQIYDTRCPDCRVFFGDTTNDYNSGIGMKTIGVTVTFNINDADDSFVTQDSLTLIQNITDLI